MYVAFDLTRLVFLRKHQNVFTLAELMENEFPDNAIGIEPCNTNGFLQGLTDLELKMLYMNTTNVEQKYFRKDLRLLLSVIVSKMPYSYFSDGYRITTYEQQNEAEIIKSGQSLLSELYPNDIVSSPIEKPWAKPEKVIKPKTGTTKQLIWEVANAEWIKASKPITISEILKLRKLIMQILENDYQIKKTSSSNELGNWQKATIV